MLTVALVVADEQVREDLRGILSALSVRLVLDQPAAAEWSTFMTRLRRLTPDLVVIDARQFQDPFVGAAADIRSLTPAPTIIAVVDNTDAEAALKAMRAGANECVLPPFDASLRDALERVSRRRAVPERKELPAGKMIGFLSVKGGCGATTIACHVAAGLCRATEHEVLLADCDLNVGVVGLLMKAQTPHSVLDAVECHYSREVPFWWDLVWKNESRLHVLPAPANPPCEQPLEAFPFQNLLRSMKSQYRWTVADLGRGLNFLTRALLEELDGLFLVSTPDVPALYQAKQVVQSLLHSGYNFDRLALILNRVPKYCEFTTKDIHDLLQVRVFSGLAECSELEQAFGHGRLVAAESHSGKLLAALAKSITGVKPVEVRSWHSIFGVTRPLPAAQG